MKDYRRQEGRERLRAALSGSIEESEREARAERFATLVSIEAPAESAAEVEALALSYGLTIQDAAACDGCKQRDEYIAALEAELEKHAACVRSAAA